jgi:hypothetical protein
MVGTSGRAGSRRGAFTAIARSAPERMCGIVTAPASIVRYTRPAMRSVTPAPAVLYGTCCAGKSSARRRISMLRCGIVPLPAE